MIDEWTADIVARTQHLRNGGTTQHLARLERAVFGDRVGLALWLGVVLSLGLFWRVGFFITDTYPIANAVANLAEGRIAMQPTDFQYSLTLGTQPGLHEYQGNFYARNYGQVVWAVPVLWGLEAASVVAAPRLVLAAAWSAGLVLFARTLASVLDRPELRQAGSVLALAWFVGAVVFATELASGQLALVALQLSTLLAAGLVAVFCYRLVGAFHGRRVAVAAGVGITLATPIGFWATIPKRHVTVTAMVFISVYAFARSRQCDGLRSDLALGGAYGALGLLAWIHAFEGFFLVLALFVVDFVTELRKERRRIAVVAGIFALSILPMALTNMVINGNPLQPPRLMKGVGPGTVELAPETPADTGGSDSGSSGGPGDGGTSSGESGADGGTSSGESDSGDEPGDTGPDFSVVLAPLLGLLSFVETVVDQFSVIGTYAIDTASEGLERVQETDRLWNVFVRRGYYEYGGDRLAVNDFETIDLTVLESTPIAGTLLALPAVAIAQIRRHGFALRRLTPARQTDLLVVSYVSVLTVVYLPRLPLFSQLTVRYLLPAIALIAYLTVRIPAVREGIKTAPSLLAGVYVGSAVLGTAAFVLVLGSLAPGLGEAVQFHALVNLAVASVAITVVAGRTIAPTRVSPRAVAVVVALAAGSTTALICLGSIEYFTYGPFAFDVVGEVARAVSVL